MEYQSGNIKCVTVTQKGAMKNYDKHSNSFSDLSDFFNDT